MEVEDNKYRIENDSVGECKVPVDAYYGIHSVRAKENFNITGNVMPHDLIVALAQIKKACAITNYKSTELTEEIKDAIVNACDLIIDGKYHEQFIVDQIQGGAGTSANMSANEVIANIALELLGKEKSDYKYCHPNDHVNMGQSTNDVYPTSLKITLYLTGLKLVDKLDLLEKAFDSKSQEFSKVLKIGRTQLMDAVPITLGQEFAAFSSAVKRNKLHLKHCLKEMLIVNMGATAIGTGINASNYFYNNIINELKEVTNLEVSRSENLVEGTQNIDGFSIVSSALKTAAMNLSKISNDIRLMNSGPKAGFGEITIPEKQNGSSIMPGKINPVIPEVLNQACFLTIGNDVSVTLACEAGQFELNAFEPLVFNRLFESMSVLTNAVTTFVYNCVEGIVANEERCQELLFNSTGLITALCPIIGYDAAAKIAKEFLKSNTPILEQVKGHSISQELLDEILDAKNLTRIHEEK